MALVIFISLGIYDRVTIPPSKVIADYQTIEGELIKVGGSRGYGVRIKNKDQIIMIRFSGEKRHLYRTWIGEVVIAYYWPERLFNFDNTLVVMTPISQKSYYLKKAEAEKRFNNPNIGTASMRFILLVIFMLLVGPRLMQLLEKNRRKPYNDFIKK